MTIRAADDALLMRNHGTVSLRYAFTVALPHVVHVDVRPTGWQCALNVATTFDLPQHFVVERQFPLCGPLHVEEAYGQYYRITHRSLLTLRLNDLTSHCKVHFMTGFYPPVCLIGSHFDSSLKTPVETLLEPALRRCLEFTIAAGVPWRVRQAEDHARMVDYDYLEDCSFMTPRRLCNRFIFRQLFFGVGLAPSPTSSQNAAWRYHMHRKNACAATIPHVTYRYRMRRSTDAHIQHALYRGSMHTACFVSLPHAPHNVTSCMVDLPHAT